MPRTLMAMSASSLSTIMLFAKPQCSLCHCLVRIFECNVLKIVVKVPVVIWTWDCKINYSKYFLMVHAFQHLYWDTVGLVVRLKIPLYVNYTKTNFLYKHFPHNMLFKAATVSVIMPHNIDFTTGSTDRESAVTPFCVAASVIR